MPEEGKHRIGRFGSGLWNENGNTGGGQETPNGTTHADRPHSHQQKVVLTGRSVVPSFSSGSDHRLLQAKGDPAKTAKEDLSSYWRKESSRI
ncbi:unnamed protein product [Strongylus vulgaris]|uniref:Uncharacterized protein n=1 Tax=Strongylus vulgaris TaxID=40348 RepID=A0A3P7K7Z5_STRVU|nr:unnamed protein product [Strongylus vulgaris]